MKRSILSFFILLIVFTMLTMPIFANNTNQSRVALCDDCLTGTVVFIESEETPWEAIEYIECSSGFEHWDILYERSTVTVWGCTHCTYRDISIRTQQKCICPQ